MEIVYLSQLEDVKILWPGDIHALAEFILRCRNVTDEIANARNPGSQQTSRPTINGLVGHFANVTNVSLSQTKQQLQPHGFSLGATVDFDPAPNTSTG
jgi:hypothetical protein